MAPQRSFAAPPSKPKPTREAKAHFNKALEFYKAEDWAAAAAEFEAAYQETPSPDYLYAWGQAERKRGECRKALELFRQFVDTGPSETSLKAANTLIASCEEEIEREGPVAVPPPPPAGDGDGDATDQPEPEPNPRAEGPEADTGPDEQGPQTPWGRDPAGASLTAIGSVFVLTGGGLLAIGGAQGSAAQDADDYGGFRAEREQSIALTVSGGVVGGVGLGLLIGGIVRYAVVAKRAKESLETARAPRRPRIDGVGMSLDANRVGLSFSGRF